MTTPRTDSVISSTSEKHVRDDARYFWLTGELSVLARTLERELTAAQAELEAAKDTAAHGNASPSGVESIERASVVPNLRRGKISSQHPIEIEFYLDDDVEALRKLLSNAQEQHRLASANAHMHYQNSGKWKDRAEAAEAALAEARKDAERYRWLRDEKNLDEAGNLFDSNWGKELDAAIDAARDTTP